MENKMKEVAHLIGLELEEEFRIEGFDNKYKFTNYGLMNWSDNLQQWFRSSKLNALIRGELTIIKLPKPILTEKEKEYLSNVIKPFRNRIIYIEKYYLGDREYIEICLKHFMDDDNYETLVLPEFEKGTMYNGMELNKEYTLDELGL